MFTTGLNGAKTILTGRDWSDPSTCPGSGEVGDWKDKLRKKNPGWNDVLSKVKKTPGSNIRKV